MAGHYHSAEVDWTCAGDFAANAYSRAHVWRFDGGLEVPASASPSVVPLPYSVEAAVDPEEALVAAISSCHMMSFLHLARRANLNVSGYRDRARGELNRVARGRMAITKVVLRPEVTLAGGDEPDPARLSNLHEEAHGICFIANSVKCEIVVEPAPLRRVAPSRHADV
ncbi:OsmC family protein [Roseibium salinum]|uniref:OsmC family protein n=1 Tax=Roseibium salinum TaxID=1604349 RepID=A0ABT3R429_9HYPH|nr:OsmC family protein [Roseibium sp. DSM 29163]MCX2723806.1 OsmC family protein [Roseibium sp. DSM 29163]MDN3718366.1 OsmC family protein [Roseibium salinum]